MSRFWYENILQCPFTGPWTSFGNTWGSNPVLNNTNGGSWPQRRPPPQLRALTPPPNRPRLQPLSSPQYSSNWNSNSGCYHLAIYSCNNYFNGLTGFLKEFYKNTFS